MHLPSSPSSLVPSLMALGALAATGCGPGAEPSDAATCDETSTALMADDVSPLGFTARQVLDALVQDEPDQTYLFWADDAAGYLDIWVRYEDGAVTHVDSEVAGGVDDAAMPLCEDRMEIEAVFVASSDDGRLDETWDVVIRATDPTAARLDLDVDLSTLQGSLDADAFLAGIDYDTVRGQVQNRFDVHQETGFAVSQGQLDLVYEVGPEGDDPDGVAQAGILTVASWGQDLFE